MFAAHDDVDLAGRPPSSAPLPTVEARLRGWLPHLILAGAMLLGLLFPVI